MSEVPRFRRKSKLLRYEMSQVDYWDKLSVSEREWLNQFMFEYHGADFAFDNPIHPVELRKERYAANNASKRQLHSVGSNLIKEAEQKAFQENQKHKNNTRYSPSDYGNFDLNYSEEDENDK